MYLRSFEAKHFRNISRLEIKPHPRFNILYGENGQGKTNLLEGIYLLSASKSFRPHTNADLVEFNEKNALLRAELSRGGIDHAIEVDIDEDKKSRLLNGRQVSRREEFAGLINVVLFGPQDLSLFRGSPSRRREFIDETISTARPKYITDLRQYEDIRRQRNEVLKQSDPDSALLDVYTDQLVEYGTTVTKNRLDFLTNFEPRVQHIFQEIFSANISPSLSYSLKWANIEIEEGGQQECSKSDIRAKFIDVLEERKLEEREKGYTLVGPHRDDLIGYLNGKNLKIYGSQGQHRAFVLALKIAEIQRMDEEFKFAPIFLLDDVSSELDRTRNEYLFEFLNRQMDGQVVITTTHRDHILIDESDSKSFKMRDGQIERCTNK